MSRQRRLILEGLDLLPVLARTTVPIKWFTCGGSIVSDPSGDPVLLTPAQAALIVRAGQYVGETTPAQRRVYCIREVDVRAFVVDSSLWDDRGVTRFSTDLRNIPDRVKRRETVELWDRILAHDPPPRSWSCS